MIHLGSKISAVKIVQAFFFTLEIVSGGGKKLNK